MELIWIKTLGQAQNEIAAAITPEALAEYQHDDLQGLQWVLDAAIGALAAAKAIVHDAREREYLGNAPPASPDAHVVGFGRGPLQLTGGK